MGRLRAILPVLALLVAVGAAAGADADAAEALQARLDELYDRIDGNREREVQAEARALLGEVEAEHGNESVAAAEVLEVLVEAYRHEQRRKSPEEHAEMHALILRALRIKEERLGPDHRRLANTWRVIGYLARDDRDEAAARRAYERALAIVENALGPEDPEVARYLNILGNQAQRLREFDRAEALLLRAVALHEKQDGPDHESVARLLANLSAVYGITANFDAAESALRRAIGILERSLGRDHYDLAVSYHNLGLTLYFMGDYPAAHEALRRALVIREAHLGDRHPEVAATANALGLLLQDMGEYAAARKQIEWAIQIVQEALGEESRQLGIYYNTLGKLLAETGDLADAREVLERAVAIKEKLAGPDDPDVATSLTNLAVVLRSSGERDGARRMLERALRIKRDTLGADHPQVASTTHALAELAHEGGDAGRALQLHEQALALRRSRLGSAHPDVAKSLAALATFHAAENDLEAARLRLAEALTIREQSVGPDHPEVARLLAELAELALRQGNRAEALERTLGAETIARAHLRITTRGLAEAQALRFAAERPSGLGLALTLAADDPSRAWDALARSRAVVLDEIGARHRIVAASSDPEVAALRDELDTARRRLAHLLVRITDTGKPDRDHRLVAELRRELERSELRLAAGSAEYRREREAAQAGLREILDGLEPGDRMVGYARYERTVAGGDPASGGRLTRVPSYLAFVLDAERRPRAVPLGDAETIDRSIGAWRAAASARPPAVKALRARAEQAYRDAAVELRRLVWDPLAAHVEGARRLFVVPDGALHLVNIGVLQSDDGGYLVEDGPLVHYLSAERDIVALREKSTTGAGLLAVGGPDYDGTAAGGVTESPPSPAYRGTAAPCDTFRSLRFEPLPAAAAEAREIAELWRGGPAGSSEALILVGSSAAEGRVKRDVSGRRVIHLATHGFFLDGECAANPLRLTGLGLSGANARAALDDGAEDGILTAEEIASLDLRAAEWVVLSACETGVGEVVGGEGVLGLRRAFQTAGASTLVMSLWAVEDEASRRWMRELYTGRLAGRGTAESVRHAQLTVLETRRRSGQSTHPFYWGAFVATGDWR